MTLPGPSRTIIVEPIEVPAEPARRPETAPAEPERLPDQEPVETPAPQREPVNAAPAAAD